MRRAVAASFLFIFVGCMPVATRAQENACDQPVASRQRRLEIEKEADRLYGLVSEGTDPSANTEKLKSLLCEVKTTTYGPGSCVFVHVMLNYARALLRLRRTGEAAHAIAMELSPTSAIIADPQGLERLTAMVFDHGTPEDKRRLKGFYMTHQDLLLDWIDFKLKRNLPVAVLDVEKVERLLTPFQRLISLLPREASGAWLGGRSQGDTNDRESMHRWAFHAADAFNLSLYRRALARVHGSVLKGYTVRTGFMLTLLLFALLGMATAGFKTVKAIRRLGGPGKTPEAARPSGRS